MRILEASRLEGIIEELLVQVSVELPVDIKEALLAARQEEPSQTGRSVLDLILENAEIASREEVPICQDTGFFTIFLDLHPDTCLTGDTLAAARRAVLRATRKASLRPSVVRDPMGRRENTGDNTPPLIEVRVSEAETNSLGVMAKGGGSEMSSSLAMLPPGAGFEGVLEFVVGAVETTGARSCPPLVLGVGVGGSFDSAPGLAKRALMVPLDSGDSDPETVRREVEIKEAVNRLGIGPGAFGGGTTCLGVRLKEAPCHMANLPVALDVACHALRRITVLI